MTNYFAKSIIEQQLPELSPVDLKCIGDGLDNKVFLVNEQFIFKFPHKNIAAKILEQEFTVLKNLRGFFNLHIPNPVYIGKPNDDYAYPFYGYPLLAGHSTCQVELSATVRNNSIRKLAEFLRCLHSIHETEARVMGAKEQVFDRCDFKKVMLSLRKGVEKINALKHITINLDILDAEMKKAAAITLSKTKVLVHGDLYSRHLLFDNTDLVGIIDWGQVGINHPAVDLSLVFSFYPTSYHQVFFDVYGNIDLSTYIYARFLGLYSSLMVMLYALSSGDLKLLQEADNAVQNINPLVLQQRT